MCMICVDFQRERMSLFEAKRAFGEMIEGMEPEHAREVREMLNNASAAQRTASKSTSPSTSPSGKKP